MLRQNAYPFDAKTFFGSFWTNPFRFPDFGLVWWGRFFIILASFLFTTFRLFYMKQHLGFGDDDVAAAAAVTTGVGIYTVVLIISSVTAGWISLVLDVLPNPDDAGKDLGVFNMANALPQSLAPYFGSYLLGTLGGGTNFTWLFTIAGIAGLLGAVIVLPIKGAK